MKFLLVLFVFFVVTNPANSNVFVDFSQSMTKICGKKFTLHSKKVMLIIMRKKNNGEDPCEEPVTEKFLKKCEKTVTCDEIVVLFDKIQYKYSGSIFGGEN